MVILIFISLVVIFVCLATMSGTSSGPPSLELVQTQWNSNSPGVIVIGNVTKANPRVTKVGFEWSNVSDLSSGVTRIEQTPTGTGRGQFTIQTTVSPGEHYGRIYAYNGEYTYNPIFTFVTGLCLVEGTMISLADGTSKPIENITYEDQLRVWNFDDGHLDTAKPLWIKEAEIGHCYTEINFDDGTQFCVFNSHRVFNLTTKTFEYANRIPDGTLVYKQDGVHCRKVGHRLVNKTIKYYNIITRDHMNLFANGLLSSCRFNNVYPIQQMKFVKEPRDIRDLNLFPGIDPDFYHTLRLGEQTVISVEESNKYINDRLVKNNILFLDHHGVMFHGQFPGKITRYYSDNQLVREVREKIYLPDFDLGAVSELNKFLSLNPTYQIVVSSDWKNLFSLTEMQEFYRRQGIIKIPIDYTPTLPMTAGPRQQRAAEINQWLAEHKTEKYLVIDDLKLDDYFSENFIRVVSTLKI